MAEIEEKIEKIEEGSPKKWTDEDVTDKVVKRVRNLHSENDDLKRRIKELENISKSNQVNNPVENNESSPNPDFKKLMNNQTESIRQAVKDQQHESTVHGARQKIQQMISEDKDFKKLALNEDGKSHPVPEEVAVHLATQFDPKVAKNILRELLTDKNFHMNMENHLLKGQDEYNKWLNQLMNKNQSEKFENNTVPDLSGEGGESAAPSDGNLMEYINSY